MHEMLLPAAAVLLGYVVLGITGFGSALVIVPLLAWHWPLTEIVPIVLVLDVMASLLLGGLNARQVAMSEMVRLLPGMVVGVLAGLWLSGVVDTKWPLLVLGLYVALVGVKAICNARTFKRTIPANPWVHIAGAAIGAVEMLFGTAGPLTVAWLSRRLPDVKVLRATTPVVIMLSACAALIMMAWSGRLSDVELWWRILGLGSLAVIGVLLGHRCARYVPVKTLRTLICALLVVSGLSLIVHTVASASW
jgi:uncharacterized membrane protein YfcA